MPRIDRPLVGRLRTVNTPHSLSGSPSLTAATAGVPGLLEQARRIAAADPKRFQQMQHRSTGYGYRI